jgi:arylsulfatase
MKQLRRNSMKTIMKVLVITLVLACAATTGYAAAKPNIVLIFMDNFGYGELGVYGGGITRGAPTPRIDTLAEEGIRLTNFNVGRP